MSWNYRVIERARRGSDDSSFGIHEVYYDEQNRVTAWSENPIAVTAESAEDLAEEMDLMREALAKPVLNEAELMREIEARGRAGEGE